jgi:hypothetical protein
MQLRHILILAAFLLCALPAGATTRYVAQTAGTVTCNGGSQTAITLATWKTTSESPGDITYVCGTITGAGGSDGFVFSWSGTSGSPLQLIFDTGAQLNAPYWGTGYGNQHGAIVISGQNYITVNGQATGNAGGVNHNYVANGIIQNTLSGTSGGTCPGGTCVSGNDTVLVALKNFTGVTIENIGLLNCYVRTSQTDENNTTSGTTIDIEPGTNGVLTITNTQITNCSGAMIADLTSGTLTTLNFYNNEVTAVSSGTDIAQGGGNTGIITTLNWYGNWIHDFGPTWNDGSCSPYDFHHDGIHIFSYTTALTGLNVYDNYFSGDMGAGTAWIYYEQYASGTGTLNVFNNIINSYATTNCGGQQSQSLEFEGNAVTGLIYNNTIIGVNHSGTIMSGLYNNGAPAANMDVRNNTIGGYLIYVMQGGSSNGSGVATTSNNNNYDNTNAGGWNTQSYNGSTLSAWRSACSCDASAFTGAPNINASYQPNSGSPLLAAGANLTGTITGINVDYYGTARPSSGAWAVGAAQAASSSGTGSSVSGGVKLSGGAKVQ